MIRDWVKSINNVSSPNGNFAAFYEYADNGNVSKAQLHNPQLDPDMPSDHRHYHQRFSYDRLSRLTGADYGFGADSSSAWFDVGNLAYDKAGNVQSLQRADETGALIDRLRYDYSGNLTSQSGKIANITGACPERSRRKHRNLPQQFSLASGMNVYAAYNADGQRILKETSSGAWQFYVMDGAQTLAVIENGTLSHFNLVGNATFGRIAANAGIIDTSNARRYYLTDHLGSTRAVVDDQGTVLETHDYYPFGLQMPQRDGGTNTTLEKFTGKERDTEGNLNLDYFGARYYDPAIGRWHSVDPLAHEYPGWSPYNYTLNNPVNLIDRLGLCPEDGSAGDAGDGDGYCMEEIVVTATRIDETGSRPFSNTLAALPALGATTQIDSPVLPFADVAAGAALLGFAAYDAYLIFNPVSAEPIFVNAEKSRSLDDPESLEGATKEEVEELIPDSWVESPARTGRGTRYANPAAKGEQVRVMDGNPRDPNPKKRGPYVRVSKNGKVSDPVPLKGNSIVR